MNPLFYCPVCGRKCCISLGSVCVGCQIVAKWERRPGVGMKISECFYCKRETVCVDDHVVPVARGGSGQHWNIVRACVPCNSSKSDMLPSEWCPDNEEALAIQARVPVIFPRMRRGFIIMGADQI